MARGGARLNAGRPKKLQFGKSLTAGQQQRRAHLEVLVKFLQENSTRLMAGPLNAAVLRELRSEAATLATLGQALDRLDERTS